MIDFKAFRWLRIEPVDAWFFRDGRPSNHGEDQSDLVSDFPPNPTTIVGALRAALARANGWSGQGSWATESQGLKDVLGDGFDNLGKLAFQGPFLCKRVDRGKDAPREELLWPLPQHVVGRTTGGRFSPESMLEPSSEAICCDINTTGVKLPALRVSAETDDDQMKNPPSHLHNVFITTSGMNSILAGRRPEADDCIHAAGLFAHESRVGILRDLDTRTTGRNALYSPRYVRLKPGVSLVEGVAGVPADWDLPTLMPLGGESRMATVEALEQPLPMPKSNGSDGLFVVSLSPATFDKCWWGAGPGDPGNQLDSSLKGTVETAVIGRPLRIGGWDSAQNAPRPLAPYTPPGTVWWLHSRGGGAAGLIQIGQSTAYGYGLAIVGGSSARSGS